MAPVGPGTRWLTQRVAGDRVDIVGPLGRPFPLPVAGRARAGSAGAARRRWLRRGAALRARRRAARARLRHHHGARRRDAPTSSTASRKRAASADRVAFATEDGSVGVTGRVTAAFDPLLTNIDVVYACGPMADARRGLPARRCGRRAVLHRGRGSDGLRHRRLHDVRAAGAARAARTAARAYAWCAPAPTARSFRGDAVQFDLIGKPPPAASCVARLARTRHVRGPDMSRAVSAEPVPDEFDDSEEEDRSGRRPVDDAGRRPLPQPHLHGVRMCRRRPRARRLLRRGRPRRDRHQVGDARPAARTRDASHGRDRRAGCSTRSACKALESSRFWRTTCPGSSSTRPGRS